MAVELHYRKESNIKYLSLRAWILLNHVKSTIKNFTTLDSLESRHVSSRVNLSCGSHDNICLLSHCENRFHGQRYVRIINQMCKNIHLTKSVKVRTNWVNPGQNDARKGISVNQGHNFVIIAIFCNI